VKQTFFVRVLDELGRVVIPKDVRSELGITPGTTMEIHVTDRGILLRPYRPRCMGCGTKEDLHEVAVGVRICRACAARVAEGLSRAAAAPERG
jgi:transcriptional pleiotropic regulator of transition state genes